MKQTVILGGGGHAKVVIEVLRQAALFEPVACVDSQGSGDILGVPIVGDDARLPELLNSGINHAFVAIGSNRLRAKLMDKLREFGFQIVTVISPHAIVSPSAMIGEGVVIMPGAHVGTEARIESGTILNSNSNVDHDCVIGANCHLAPGSTLAGGVIVGAETFIATGVSVIPYIRIGSRAVVGAGSVVIRDVPDGVTTFGVPAHHHQRANVDEATQDHPS